MPKSKLTDLHEKALKEELRKAEKAVADTIVRWTQAQKGSVKAQELEQATNLSNVKARQNLEGVLLELQNRKLQRQRLATCNDLS